MHMRPMAAVPPSDHPPFSAPPAGLLPNGRRVLEARYLRRDRHRVLQETPEELFRRVARTLAAAECLAGNGKDALAWEEDFFRVLDHLEFLPNSPALMNAGTPLGQLSACFVLPVPDSLEGVFDAVKQMAVIHATGGGTGFSFSQISPRGDWLAATGGRAAGPVAFMKIFDYAAEHIQSGNRRRGASMGVLRVDHPDILEFIKAKGRGHSLRNFNLSVGVTDAFMRAVREGDRFALAHPGVGRVTHILPAQEIFEAIVEAAWETGDPGLLFLDAIKRANPTPLLGELEATNPCGEVPLLPNESCHLGSINLARMLRGTNGKTSPDWDRLRATTRTAVRFLDDMVELNRYPTDEIERVSRGNRKIGLGVMGFAEMLIRLGISYDSDPAVQMANEVMQCIQKEAARASEALAEERGAFPNWPASSFAENGPRRRNATVTAIAPTGTTAIIAGTSAGIAPLFALAYRRRHVLDGRTLVEINPLLRELLERRRHSWSALLKKVENTGSLSKRSSLRPDIRRLFLTALEVPPRRYLQVQAAFQRHVENAVAATVHLPAQAASEDVAEVFHQAWDLGLKGVTVYRDGSKTGQVLEAGLGRPGGGRGGGSWD